ncbi:MAG: superfamily I DNA/RNA helicase [Paraglaciecola sp.]|jgi:superfamily I DNA/RNA helicase
MEEPYKLKEERRLAYFGITRAMKKLYLIYTKKNGFTIKMLTPKYHDLLKNSGRGKRRFSD